MHLETQPKSSKIPHTSKSKTASVSESKRKGQQEMYGKSEATTTKPKKEQDMVKSSESKITTWEYWSVVV